jgi:hypothetical protein
MANEARARVTKRKVFQKAAQLGADATVNV